MRTKKRLCCVCKRKSIDRLCQRCHVNPFRLEDYRNILALKKDYEELKKWYKPTLAEIPNLNTPKFWNKKLKSQEFLSDQDGMTQNRIKTVESFVDRNAKRILDIGAGHGYLEEYLSKKRNLKLSGNDFSKESVQHLRGRFKGDFQVMSIYNLKYKPKSFDSILILEVLEHIPPKKIFFVLKSLKKLLKPKGQLIISVPTNEGLERMKANNNGHTRTYTIPLITAELEISGFKVEKIQTLYAFDSNYKFKNFIAKFYKKWSPNNIIVTTRLI